MGTNFEDLLCWRETKELTEYFRREIIPSLPKSEMYELKQQLLRALRSAPANIAEGWGRFHYKDNIRFLLNARGSIAEVLNHSLECYDCEYITKDQITTIRSKTDSCIKLINGYIRYLKTMDQKRKTP